MSKARQQKYRIWTLEAPEVQAIFCDVIRSTGKKSYYRVDASGKHVVCRIKQELIALGMGGVTASALAQAADLPCAPFVHNRNREPRPAAQQGAPPPPLAEAEIRPPVIAAVEDTSASVPELEMLAPEILLLNGVQLGSPTCRTVPLIPVDPLPSKKKYGVISVVKDESYALEDEAEALANRKRYSLLKQESRLKGTTTWGVFDAEREAVVALYQEKDEAQKELARLKGRRIYHPEALWDSCKKLKHEEPVAP